MNVPKIVLDTNVLVSALKSRRGASFAVLSLVGQGVFEITLSVPLVLEYESAAKKMCRSAGLRHRDVDDILDYLCKVGEHRQIFYLWRPFLRDPLDDMVLELAVESECDLIVTHNTRHFKKVDQFGVAAMSPGAFLRMIGEIQ
jgi:putative PIN family toxin of toxin-antitoxin system